MHMHKAEINQLRRERTFFREHYVRRFNVAMDQAGGVRALQRYLAYEPHEGDPARSSAHYRLGLVYERMGDREGARREFEASLRLEPTRDEVKAALARLR